MDIFGGVLRGRWTATPLPLTAQNRCRGLVAEAVGSVGWPFPRLNHPWLPRTMAASLEVMVALFFFCLLERKNAVVGCQHSSLVTHDILHVVY